jgi:hypothetical protein
MKKCGYCGFENKDNVNHCHDCGTEFTDTQALKRQAALETTEIRSDDSPGNEALHPASVSAHQGTSGSFPLEFCMLCGIAISASGNFHMFIVIVIFYLFLKPMQPSGDRTLAMLASGFTGGSIMQFVQMLAWNKGPVHFLEPAVVAIAALILLTTERRGLAWFLLVYSAFGVLINLLSALGFPRNVDLQIVVFRMIFLGLEIWLLVRWLRRKRPAGSLHDKEKHTQIPNA